MSRKEINVPVREVTVRVLTPYEVEDIVREVFGKHHYWCCTGNVCPIYIPKLSGEFDVRTEAAVEDWKTGRNGPRYSVGTEAMLRYLCGRGVVPEGNYLVTDRVKDEEPGMDPADYPNYESPVKGVL